MNYEQIRAQFHLTNELAHLNHGSFGACPKPVFKKYQEWQLALEQSPVQFMTEFGLDQLKKSKKELASFINCQHDDLVYTTNPSYALNIIIKSMELKPGDEVLSTNHEYGALDKTWNYYCDRTGASYVQQKINLPIQSKQHFLDQFWAGLSKQTRVVFVSHISSSTALKFPVEDICKQAKELGLMTIVDGAHGPGHVPIDLKALDADIYAGACHKWMMAPKGSSFLYVRKNLQEQFDPLLISWGYDSSMPSHSKFLDYHEYQGTRDFSAFLVTPDMIDFYSDYNWDSVKSRNRALILANYPKLVEAADSYLICPNDEMFLGQMCSIPIKTADPIGLKKRLLEQFKLEIPVFEHQNWQFIRLSVQGYNNQSEIDCLINSIEQLRDQGVISSCKPTL